MADWTLRDLYTAVRLALRDGWTGTTSGTGTTTTLVASAFAYGSDNAWLASEIYLFAPSSGSDTNPVRVTAFSASTGTFTFTPAITLGSTASGKAFILGNRDGQRWTHEEVIAQIQGAIRRAGYARPASDTSLSIVANQRIYTLPAGWVVLDGVDYLAPGGGIADEWLPISLSKVDRARVTIDGTFALADIGWVGNQRLRLRGKTTPSIPTAMTDTIQADPIVIRDDAVYELLLMSPDGPDRQRAAAMQPAVLRARAGAALARL